jgi:hypothetical protein
VARSSWPLYVTLAKNSTSGLEPGNIDPRDFPRSRQASLDLTPQVRVCVCARVCVCVQHRPSRLPTVEASQPGSSVTGVCEYVYGVRCCRGCFLVIADLHVGHMRVLACVSMPDKQPVTCVNEYAYACTCKCTCMHTHCVCVCVPNNQRM